MMYRKCSSPSVVKAELERLRQKSLQDTRSLEQGIVQITACCNNGGCKFPTELLASIRSLSKTLNHAINSDRMSLSGAAIDLLTSLSTGLGPSFAPLLPLFFPTLLGLCARTNKVFTTRAKSCIFAVIKDTQSPSVLPCLTESLRHRAPSVRLAAAEGILMYLSCLKLPIVENVSRACLLEEIIKMAARDASAEVRQAGTRIFEAYKALSPGRVESFTETLTPVSKKRLTATTAPQVTSQVPLRGRVRFDQTSTRQAVPCPPSERPAVSTNQHPQRVGKPTNGKPGTGCTVVARVIRKAGPPPPKASLANGAAAKKIPINSTSALPSRTKPQPSTNAVRPATRGTSSGSAQLGSHGSSSTEVQLQVSQASRRRTVALRSNRQDIGPKKPVWGGRSVPMCTQPIVKAVSTRSKLGSGAIKKEASGERLPQTITPYPHPPPSTLPLPRSSPSSTPAPSTSTTTSYLSGETVSRDVSRACLGATASSCDVKNQDACIRIRRTPLSSIQGGSVPTPSSHVPRGVSRPSAGLQRAPRRPRRVSTRFECTQPPQDCTIDDTPSSSDRPIRPLVLCIQLGSPLSPLSPVQVPRDVIRPSAFRRKAPRRPRRGSLWMQLPQSPQDRIDAAPSSSDRSMTSLSCIQHESPPSYEVHVPCDVNRPSGSSVEVVPQGESLWLRRGAKFAIFMDPVPGNTDSELDATLANGPSSHSSDVHVSRDVSSTIPSSLADNVEVAAQSPPDEPPSYIVVPRGHSRPLAVRPSKRSRRPVNEFRFKPFPPIREMASLARNPSGDARFVKRVSFRTENLQTILDTFLDI